MGVALGCAASAGCPRGVSHSSEDRMGIRFFTFGMPLKCPAYTQSRMIVIRNQRRADRTFERTEHIGTDVG